MIILLNDNSSDEEIHFLIDYLQSRDIEMSYKSEITPGVINITAGAHNLDTKHIEQFCIVNKAVRITSPHPLVSSAGGGKKKTIQVGKHTIGADRLTIIAGPCSLEDDDTTDKLLGKLSKMDIDIIRAGAYKPRTSPYSFQGLGDEGLKVLRHYSNKYDLPVITELLDPRDLQKVHDATDIIQIGMRNMRNYALLKEVGKQEKPIFLKRASDASVDEWLMAAEYILSEGNEDLILCERGITNPVSCKKVLLDLNGAIEALGRTNLPIIIDPSHAAADRYKVPSLTRAAAAASADGLMIEVHPDPLTAKSDGFQALLLEELPGLISDARSINAIIADRTDENKN